MRSLRLRAVGVVVRATPQEALPLLDLRLDLLELRLNKVVGHAILLDECAVSNLELLDIGHQLHDVPAVRALELAVLEVAHTVLLGSQSHRV